MGEIPEFCLMAAFHFSCIRFDLPCKHFEQCSFTDAIVSDHSYFVATHNFNAKVLNDGDVIERFADFFNF